MRLSDYYKKANSETISVKLKSSGEDDLSIECRLKSSPEFKQARRVFDSAMFTIPSVDASSDNKPTIEPNKDLYDDVSGKLVPNEKMMMLQAEMYSSLVVSWCFDDDCTRDAVAGWLYSNPEIMLTIDVGLGKYEADLEAKKNS